VGNATVEDVGAHHATADGLRTRLDLGTMPRPLTACHEIVERDGVAVRSRESGSSATGATRTSVRKTSFSAPSASAMAPATVSALML